MDNTFIQYVINNPDYIVLVLSCTALLMFFIRWVIGNNNNSDDDDNGGGGKSNDDNDPVLDLPPGVCLPKDSPEPELV